ncbi:PWWP domain-containing DNA repair factor 3A, partial [Salvelinus sp. IW2-2015]|uniref:PWWP domain-containing DNA repair factor 3A n=1 Tax=Salvelinus sp. IW2-2015 TaxID=2691554 RepID=UPI0038D419E9
ERRVKDPAVGKRVKDPAVGKRLKDPAVGKRVKDPAVGKRVKTQCGKRVKTQCGKKVKTAAEGGSQTCSSEGPPAKHRRRSRKGLTAEGVERVGLQSDDSTSSQPIQCSRPRFELLELDSPDEDTGDASLSSNLSIELSLQEDHLSSLPLEEEEEQEDEEDLPSFLNNTKPLSITEGICVWCKFRNYPFWPAMVKSVNRKMKKASIVFIDNLLFDKKRIRKGFSVALKTLKPFDCEEADQLVCKARESYDAAIKWCLELIADYRIRIGCGFTGSFIEYFSDDISCPVRRRYPQSTSDINFPSKLMLEEQFLTSDLGEEEEEGSGRQEEERRRKRRRRKLLPDRSKAARNRANEKLVDFIVKQRRVETRLLGVIGGQQQSKWLRWFLAASRSVVDTYLEDEDQLDQVYQYLRGVYETAPLTAPCLADVDRIRLVLDVLLPEAIIYAIAGVDKLSLVKAEDKYLKGPCLSKREREEFDWMIEQQMKMKASIGHRPVH